MNSGTEGPALVVLAAGRAKRYGGVKPLAPIGPAGEAVIDLLASDALAAGFGTVVLVVGPATGPAVRYHVARTWPSWVDVRFATQAAPIGTVDAVRCALEHLPAGEPFGVANADDLYGEAALSQLAAHLREPGATNALVAYRLRDAVVGEAPVTRGVCEVGDGGILRGVVERRMVTAAGDGRFVARDGAPPAELEGDTPVSMNLWGFSPEMPAVLAAAVAEARHASEEVELLLPELVDGLLRGERPGGVAPTPFAVLPAGGRCIGVTHPGDLALVQADVAAQVGRGERPALLWAPPVRPAAG